jgi:nicotinate phosphoribosyltransferase
MSTALFTDHYELTMLSAALADGTADRSCVFEVFARSLPAGRRYGVVGGIGRLLDAVADFRFSPAEIDFLAERKVVNEATLQWLAGYQFSGDIDGYAEGELYFPNSPVLSVRASFAEGVILETMLLSILNHDCAVGSAAARMVSAANGRPLIEMGSRRTHEQSAVAAARIAYVAGLAATSNLEAGRRFGIPTLGTSAHAFTLLHDTEPDAFASQIAALGPKTTLLVDTYDITTGIANAIAVAGTELGAIRIDSGDLGVIARQARAQLDALGALGTKIVVSGDLDEYAIASLRGEPVDSYGVGTKLVIGSGAPTAGMVYKVVEVDGRPVAKRSASKASNPGAHKAIRRYRKSGTAVEEIVYREGATLPALEAGEYDRNLQIPLIRQGKVVPDAPDLAASREHLRAALVSLPWEGLSLSDGEPAIRTTIV